MSMNGCLRSVSPTSRLALEDPAARAAVLRTLMDADGVELNKLWHAVGFVLEVAAGENPFDWHGDPLTWTDTGYGPPLLLTPDDVQAIADALAAVDDEAITAAFDADAMRGSDLYCPPPEDPAGERAYLDELRVRIRACRELFSTAASRGHGALYYLT